MSSSEQGGASILTGVVTAFVVSIPSPVITYAEKLVSALVLAMVAEGGRRLVAFLWKGKKS